MHNYPNFISKLISFFSKKSLSLCTTKHKALFLRRYVLDTATINQPVYFSDGWRDSKMTIVEEYNLREVNDEIFFGIMW